MTAQSDFNSNSLLGVHFDQFNAGYKEGEAVVGIGLDLGKTVIQAVRLIPKVISLILLGLAGMSLLLTRRRFGLMATILTLTLTMPAIALCAPTARTIGGGAILSLWVLLVPTAGIIQILWGLYRLYHPEPGLEHVHRWDLGTPHRVFEWLWDLLPERLEILEPVFEPITLVLIALALFLLDSLFFNFDGEQPTALYAIPLISACALLGQMLMTLTANAYKQQLLRDQILDHQQSAESMKNAQVGMHERAVEGRVRS